MRALIVLAALAGSIFAAEELPITGVAHACFKSSDLEMTRAYYVGVLGFHEAFDVKDAAGKAGSLPPPWAITSGTHDPRARLPL